MSGLPATLLGASGTSAGVTAEDAVDVSDGPEELVALTVNVYAVPFVRLVTVQLVPEVLQVNPPGLEVAVYEVMIAPPLLAGAVHDTVASAAPAEAVTEVGAPGTAAAGVTEEDAEELTELPMAFVATTVNVYAVPLVRPVIVHEVDPVVHVRPLLAVAV